MARRKLIITGRKMELQIMQTRMEKSKAMKEKDLETQRRKIKEDEFR